MLRKMLHDAKFEEVIETAPEINPADLPEKVDRDPEWRELATYERGEVIAILTSEKVPPELFDMVTRAARQPTVEELDI